VVRGVHGIHGLHALARSAHLTDGPAAIAHRTYDRIEASGAPAVLVCGSGAREVERTAEENSHHPPTARDASRKLRHRRRPRTHGGAILHAGGLEQRGIHFAVKPGGTKVSIAERTWLADKCARFRDAGNVHAHLRSEREITKRPSGAVTCGALFTHVGVREADGVHRIGGSIAVKTVQTKIAGHVRLRIGVGAGLVEPRARGTYRRVRHAHITPGAFNTRQGEAKLADVGGEDLVAWIFT